MEGAIPGDKNNSEYRFLRLMIQENAPDILGYNMEIEEDAAAVKKHFPDFTEVVKKLSSLTKKSQKR